ncbi:MAG: ABC transporter ATP-binding protein [Planctomycetes bacterium]|nr:ABC transporter ATP-binding protein [Planctomycetota bacterium]
MDHLSNGNGPIFDVKDLCFSYIDQISALDHINLAVHPGEKLAVLGSNGSGKSTLLKILDGLYFPSSGTVRAFGQILSERALRDDRFNFEFRSRVGFVFQDSDAQLFMPSVWDEIAFGPLQLGMDQTEVAARVEAALLSLQIEKLRDRPPHQLSGGEKKRVALASVLSLSPEVWMLDEPTAGLDPRSVSWLMDFILTQGSAGKTVILSTHDLAFIEATADRVYVLDEYHQIIGEGAPRKILSDHSLLIKANLVRK